ncbi:hypothetical protein M0Q50_00945 [bacterium]|jgi:hypothetical protein|nr:hypothetical protein [bacterium]
MENEKMIEAVKKGELSTIKKGIDEGFELNTSCDDKGHTIIMYARNIPTLKMLIEAGCELDYQLSNGEYQLPFENALWDIKEVQECVFATQPYMIPIFKKFGVNIQASENPDIDMAIGMNDIGLY